jgi:putative transposase
LAEWAERHRVIKPSIRCRFNRSHRQAVLDIYVFTTLNEVREQTEKWLNEYNEERLRDAPEDMTPDNFH